MEMHVVTLVVYRPDGTLPPFTFSDAEGGEDGCMHACMGAYLRFGAFMRDGFEDELQHEHAARVASHELFAFEDVHSFVMHHMPGWAVREVRNVLAL